MGTSSCCILSCVVPENLPVAVLQGFSAIHRFLLRKDALQETGREEKREQEHKIGVVREAKVGV